MVKNPKPTLKVKKNSSKKVSAEKLSEKEVLETVSEELFSLIGVKAKPEVTEDQENDSLLVEVRGEDESGLLIGSRGKTLESLQLILGLILRQKTGEWKRVIVNVSDYREKEEERLKSLALQTAQKAKEQNSPQYLYNLTPAQRRIVHMVLSEDHDVKTESQGEGKDRFLVVTPAE